MRQIRRWINDGVGWHLSDGRADLHVVDRGGLTAVRYCYEVLHSIVGPFCGAVGPDFILMQDNAQPHTAVMEYLDQEGINVME